MSAVISLSISVLIPLCTGYTFLLFIHKNGTIPFSLKIALAYGLGLGLLSIWMLCLGICGQNFSIVSIGMPQIILSAVFLLLTFYRKKRPVLIDKGTTVIPQQKKTSSRNIQIFQNIFVIYLLFFIASTTLYVFWQSMTTPVSSWDAIAIIAYKAKIFYFEQSLPSLDLLPHKSYPLLVPFSQAWVAFNLGHWSDLLIKIIFPLAFLSYVIIQYKILEYFTNKIWSLFGCAILLSSNFFVYHATISYRDFYLMYYNCLTILLLLYWQKNNINTYLILAAFFAGFCSFTKLEGTSFQLIYLILISLILYHKKYMPIREKLINLLKFLIPSLSICILFHSFKFATNIGVYQSSIGNRVKIMWNWDYLNRVPQIIFSYTDNLFFSGNWNIIWWVTLISLIHLKNKRTFEIHLLIVSLSLYFGLYFAVGLLTINFQYIGGALSNQGLPRLILHFFPLSVFLIILLNYPHQRNQELTN